MGCYVLSVLYLFFSFLFYPKTDKKLSIVEGIVYSIGLLFCYNTFVVYFNYLMHIHGSFFAFSIINFFVGTILIIFIFRKRRVQKYLFLKKELFAAFLIVSILFLIGCFRFRGFSAISYESGDSAIHYRHALYFSKELSLLDDVNSKDLVYGAFTYVMPLSYINGGIILKLFSTFKPYKVFLGYDIFCLILSSLLFFCTIKRLCGERKYNYVYLVVMTFIYILAYPFNSFLFGFCYLGLGIMVINLLYYTIFIFDKKISDDSIFKCIIFFMILFSVFFSYYMFVPCIYLALGIYYISLWKDKKISFKKLLFYGSITLIVPFVLGFTRFFIFPRLQFGEDIGISNTLSSWGYGYEDALTIYIFIFFTWYVIFDWIKKKKKDHIYFHINIVILAGYICLFLVLYAFHFVSSYYLFKLFYLYWLFLGLGIVKRLFLYKRYLYVGGVVILLTCFYTFLNPNNGVTKFLTWLDIYHWNASTFVDNKIIYTKEELELVEKAKEYQNICRQNNRFLILGDINKNVWFYSITDMIPTLSFMNGDARNLYSLPNPSLDSWNGSTNYECAVYFYEEEKKDYEKSNFDILFSNHQGAILKKR